MISAVKWVKRGIAARFPTHEMLDDENFDKINKLLAGQLENAKLNTMNNDHSNDDETNDNDINDDETNDDDGNDDDINEDDINDHDGNSSNDKSESNDIQIDANGQPIITENNVESIYNLSTYDKKLSEPQLFSSLKGLQYYKPDELDPYITLPDLDEDRDELEILETDNLILTAKTEEDVSYLEVYVYEPDNLYVHHDIMLPSFPLCLEWLDYAPDTNTPKNLVAIGTFDPQVEIWDLDTIEPSFPVVILGQIPESGAGSNIKQKKGGPARVSKRIQPYRHIDAVLSISWNKIQRNLLATASADTTIKLWDLNNNTRALQSYEFHSSKVSQIIFNNFDNRILLSGGHDQLATCFDTRSVDSVLRFELESDVEVLKWDPVVAERFYIATEDGNLKCYDTRNKQTVYCINAHDSACSALDLSSIHSGLLVTGSSDRTVKIWSILNDLPKCLVSRDLGCGKVFTAEFSTDEEYVLAVSGSGGKLVVWNLVDNEIVRNAFPSKTGLAEWKRNEKGVYRDDVLTFVEDEEVSSQGSDCDSGDKSEDGSMDDV